MHAFGKCGMTQNKKILDEFSSLLISLKDLISFNNAFTLERIIFFSNKIYLENGSIYNFYNSFVSSSNGFNLYKHLFSNNSRDNKCFMFPDYFKYVLFHYLMV
ncbi:hypothetical protein BpHYR1_017759 [Brachionus plicatilis]|uniref:Uncharacterized protein n=1 Tax=Brachionus plicatilis TaxID=10195 RepID=A0A3M7S707_BRAPC|nr:hypothetical protein BpHYR1_017759 [Brachionus plicatilis]